MDDLTFEEKLSKITLKVDELVGHGYMVTMLLYKDGLFETRGYLPPHFDEIQQLYVKYCETTEGDTAALDSDAGHDEGCDEGLRGEVLTNDIFTKNEPEKQAAVDINAHDQELASMGSISTVVDDLSDAETSSLESTKQTDTNEAPTSDIAGMEISQRGIFQPETKQGKDEQDTELRITNIHSNLSSHGTSQNDDGKAEEAPTPSSAQKTGKKRRRKAEKEKKKDRIIGLKCDTCGKCFTDKYYLQYHVRQHTGERPYQCEICGKAFPIRNSLRMHRLRHTEAKKYSCDVCEKAFFVKGALNAHRLKHNTETPYVCEVCGKAFNHNAALKAHIQSHTRAYQCTECGESFARADHLRSHTRMHTGERPYKCFVCNKSFSDHSGLARHKRVHSGEKPFQCEVCSRSFTQSSSLKGHLKNVHKITIGTYKRKQ